MAFITAWQNWWLFPFWVNEFALFTEKITSQPKKDPVQERLDQTASLINDLQATQKERLSAKLPTHLAHVPGPSEKEIQLAQKVTQELKELAKGVSQQLHFWQLIKK